MKHHYLLLGCIPFFNGELLAIGVVEQLLVMINDIEITNIFIFLSAQ